MIGKRLRELRNEKNLLQKDVAKYLNITTSAYGYYEQDKRKPDPEMIKKLADFFNVSTDYLLNQRNLSEDPELILNYDNTEEKIRKILINENIISEDELVTKYMLDKILEHGIDAAIEILKLEKQLDK